MSTESYAFANSRPPAFPSVRAEPNLLQRFHPLSVPRLAKSLSERVEPVLQYKSNMFGALRPPAQSQNIPVLTRNEGMTPHDLRPALKSPWPRVSGTTNFRNLVSATPTRNFRRAAATPLPLTRLPFVNISAPKSPTSGVQSFLLIECVKELLSQQRIRDARHTLELGSIRCPENLQIANLLRAIAPGRVSQTGSASIGRERETTWIKQHGHKYRGLWVALDEDRLIAFATTLKELLADMDTTDEREQPPFVQHLLSE